MDHSLPLFPVQTSKKGLFNQLVRMLMNIKHLCCFLWLVKLSCHDLSNCVDAGHGMETGVNEDCNEDRVTDQMLSKDEEEAGFSTKDIGVASSVTFVNSVKCPAAPALPAHMQPQGGESDCGCVVSTICT